MKLKVGPVPLVCETNQWLANIRAEDEQWTNRSFSNASPRIRTFLGRTPSIRGRRLAVKHVLGMLAAGDAAEILLQGYPWLEKEDIQACLLYARRLVGHECIEPLKIESAA
jgi:uncharacterized protein (DUF433 family)